MGEHDENDYLEEKDGVITSTVIFRFRLDELSADTSEGVRRRKALRAIADALNGGVDVETLDGSEMGVIGVYDHLPMHCCECGVLAPEWMAKDLETYGGPYPEEICHEPFSVGAPCNPKSWQPTEAKQVSWERKNGIVKARLAGKLAKAPKNRHRKPGN